MTGFALYKFPFGFLRIGYEDSDIVSLEKSDCFQECGVKTELTNQVYTQITEYLEGKRKTFNFTYKLHGTEFQKKVWQQLVNIPYGETRTYQEIAAAIGSPKASRAVGMANHRNPMMIVVPCHRVIGAKGDLVGYAGGMEMKRALLELEQRECLHHV